MNIEQDNTQIVDSIILRSVLIIVGTVSLVLGVIGIVLPLLPTTPFLLLTAACYIRSSNRLYIWLTNNRVFGQYIKNYREGKGIPPKIKVIAITTLWATILFSIYLIDDFLIGIVLLVIALSVSIFILSIKPNEISK